MSNTYPTLSHQQLLDGQSEPPPIQLALQAGPLNMLWEQGGLRYIRYGDLEVLRGIYVAVRDPDWGTVPVKCCKIDLDQDERSFRLSWETSHQRDEIDFCWKGLIEGSADGSLVFRMNGRPRSRFMTQRIGFSVLHPDTCAGATCRVEHIDGSLEQASFPIDISPRQPFKHIGAISHQASADLWVEARFEGNAFEMEDQRNWTDASFKTYCPPLEQEAPIWVSPETEITQCVRISLQGSANPRRASDRTLPITITQTHEPPRDLPKLGLGIAGLGQAPDTLARQRLETLNLSHLYVELALCDSQFLGRLRHAQQKAQSLNVPLHIGAVFGPNWQQELQHLSTAIGQVKRSVDTWMLLSSSIHSPAANLIAEARHTLEPLTPQAAFVAGSRTNFTELNRSRPPCELMDGLCYALNPQMHAFDNRSLVETLPIQALTLRNAKCFCPRLPIHVGPITLRPRTPLDASQLVLRADSPRLPGSADPRQTSLLGASWTLGSIKQLAESGAASVTYYETSGWLGVLETAASSPLPDLFASFRNAVFPLYHVLADVGEFRGGVVIPTETSSPLSVTSCLLQKETSRCLLLANLRDTAQEIQLSSLPDPARLRWLDTSNAQEAMLAPESYRQQQGTCLTQPHQHFVLGPYAIARLRWEQ